MITKEERWEMARDWSADPNIYACLQQGLHYFDHPYGFIAYQKALSGKVVLGDPVAPPGKQVSVLTDFLKQNGNSVFSYISEEMANLLAATSTKHFRFVPIAVERCIDTTASPSFSSKILGALKKANKAGLAIKEIDLGCLCPEELEQLILVNQQFLRQSTLGKEIGFISRAMVFEKEPDVRFFAITTAASTCPIGFFVLDPWYERGKLIGYQLHQFRLGATKVWGVFLSVVAMLIQKLQVEGITKLSLGASVDLNLPLHPALPSSRLYSYCNYTTIKWADFFHPVSNLSQNKLEFAGTDMIRYLAAPQVLPFLPLFRFAKANNVLQLPKWPKIRSKGQQPHLQNK